MIIVRQVPVYEFNVEGNHVMRRRVDDWINATHILKVADFDKPARTRVLEREVQKNVHEKVQGGYGKYQGVFVCLCCYGIKKENIDDGNARVLVMMGSLEQKLPTALRLFRTIDEKLTPP